MKNVLYVAAGPMDLNSTLEKPTVAEGDGEEEFYAEEVGGETDGSEEAGSDREKQDWLLDAKMEDDSADPCGLTFWETAFLQFGRNCEAGEPMA